MTDDWEAWFDSLSRLADTPNVHNLYTGRTREGRTRLANLRRYVEQMLVHEPKVLLVGEAPGYQGSYRTGVPFGSESIVLGPQNKYGLFGGASNGYQRVFEGDKLWKEPSATVVQRTLDDLDVPLLIWATFPLHPHRPGVDLSNRAPTRSEVLMGAEVLQQLLAVARPQLVIAVGNVAAKCLGELGIDAQKVRHPSHGGATQFREQLMAMLA